jgi:hypothetical protein
MLGIDELVDELVAPSVGGGQGAAVDQLLQPTALDAVHDAEVEVAVDVDGSELLDQAGHRHLERFHHVRGNVGPIHHHGPQPVRIDGAGGDAHRFENLLDLLPLDRALRVEEADGAPLSDEFHVIHAGIPPGS